MTRRAVLPPTDTERVLTGWPRCPGERFGPDDDEFLGCGEWSSPVAVELYRLCGYDESPPCAEHLGDELYETAAFAASYGDGNQRLRHRHWDGPRHLGWAKIEGDVGRRALRRLSEAAQGGDFGAQAWHAWLLLARRERRAGRAY